MLELSAVSLEDKSGASTRGNTSSVAYSNVVAFKTLVFGFQDH